IDTSHRLHHRFRRYQVPYPRNYERKALDLDAIDTLLTRQMSGGSLTWHSFPKSWNEPPAHGSFKRILDLGCGDGVWVIEAAKYWKGCQVVGLDIVPLNPDLPRLSRNKDLLNRVSWVQANFLECLPFPNESFDFVHVKRIARGVPEDKVRLPVSSNWDDLFEEITRVMKPGAAFEVIEEELTFPGSDGEGSEVGTLRSKGSNISMSISSVVSLDSTGVIPPDPRDHTVLETIYNETHAERFINLSPLSLLANTVGLWFKGESLLFIPSFLGRDDDGWWGAWIRLG
ncbi:S-adenosyl-L-methionine-dependent methyltransferase, partial [Suillus bovinus]|uniref:S-adenosyl-L-methionine-dependent methyltransferase n=1 Tax=Suillus bovinus TaxID=48563 RepID=UPI001B87EC73